MLYWCATMQDASEVNRSLENLMPVLEREWGMLTQLFLIRIDWSCGTPPYLTVFIGWAERLSQWWKCSEISVPHQDVEVPTKSYRRMNNLGTFRNEIRQNVARNQNEILTEKNVCTEFFTKLSDSEKSWMEIQGAEKMGMSGHFSVAPECGRPY